MGCNASVPLNEPEKKFFPDPCWVVKTKTLKSGEKYFLNLVQHRSIPKNNDENGSPLLFLGHMRNEVDAKGNDAITIDVLINSKHIGADAKGEDAIYREINTAAINLVNNSKCITGDSLSDKFTIPKIFTKYKGQVKSVDEQLLLKFKTENSNKACTSENENSEDSPSDMPSDTVQESPNHDEKLNPAADVADESALKNEKNEEKLDGDVAVVENVADTEKKDEPVNLVPDNVVPDNLVTNTDLYPEPKSGFMKKKGEGFGVGWKRRFFKLEKGYLKWFVSEDEGHELKGETSLKGWTIELNAPELQHKNQIFMKCSHVRAENKRNSLLLDFDNNQYKEGDPKLWLAALQRHIDYANPLNVATVKDGESEGMSI